MNSLSLQDVFVSLRQRLIKHQCCQQAACHFMISFVLLTATSIENTPQVYLTWALHNVFMTSPFIFTADVYVSCSALVILQV